MATVKILSLVIRTLAKPISNKLKQQAQEHPSFRKICINVAQQLHTSEMRMRTGLLGEPAKHVRPLNDAKAIQSGANFISESFLFSVAAGLIMAETYRGYRKDVRRRDKVDDKFESLDETISALQEDNAKLQAKSTSTLEEVQALRRTLSHLEDLLEKGWRSAWLQHSLDGNGSSESPSDSILNFKELPRSAEQPSGAEAKS